MDTWSEMRSNGANLIYAYLCHKEISPMNAYFVEPRVMNLIQTPPLNWFWGLKCVGLTTFDSFPRLSILLYLEYNMLIFFMDCQECMSSRHGVSILCCYFS